VAAFFTAVVRSTATGMVLMTDMTGLGNLLLRLFLRDDKAILAAGTKGAAGPGP
jgi:H+/Cl- antiporter ClcA